MAKATKTRPARAPVPKQLGKQFTPKISIPTPKYTNPGAGVTKPYGY